MEEGGRKEEGRTGGSAEPKTRTPHNDVGKNKAENKRLLGEGTHGDTCKIRPAAEGAWDRTKAMEAAEQ